MKARSDGAPRGRGRPPGPPLDRDARRQQLLDAAESAIAANGPEVSLTRVAAVAGLTRSALYAAFTDRDGLLDALAQRHGASLVAGMENLAGSAADPHEQTRAAVDLLAAWFDENPVLAPALASRWRLKGRSLVETTLSEILTVGFTDRGLDPAPAPVWSRAMIGAVSATVEWWATSRELSRVELVDHVTALLWSGLSAANPAATRPVGTDSDTISPDR
nr:TetR/AcrR family transcriptional regulator [Gordonia zhaorongruii]